MSASLIIKSEFNLWFNIAIIAVLIICSVMIWFTLNYVFDKWFLPVIERIGDAFGSKIKRVWLILLIEVISLLFPFIYMFALLITYFSIDYGKDDFILYFIISTTLFLLWMLISTSTYTEFKKRHPDYKSLFIEWLKKLFKSLKLDRLRHFYVINRFMLLVEQIPDFLKATIVLYISLVLLVKLHWSNNYYFLTLCFIPLYGNYWVYYIKVFTVNRKLDEVFIRRVVMYTLMMMIATYELFSRFQAYVNEIEILNDIYVFLLAGSGVLYIALDRILKEVTVDYVKFKEKQSKTE